MSNHFPYDVYTLDSYGLSYHALARFKQLLYKENLPADIAEKIEEELIPALEYIDNHDNYTGVV